LKKKSAFFNIKKARRDYYDKIFNHERRINYADIQLFPIGLIFHTL